MSVVYLDGFETTSDQPEMLKKGLLTPTQITQAGTGVFAVPSRTGVAGNGLYLRGPYSAAVGLPCTATTVSDFGMLPLNQSVYSLWQAGGFAVGINASFNSLNTLQIAPNNAQQLCYDGSQYYWAIAYTGAAYVVVYSTDLKTWTQTAAIPTGLAANYSIAVSGTGASATVMVGPLNGGASGCSLYTTNLGVAWTAFANVGNDAGYYGAVYPTSNVSTPFIGVAWVTGVGYRIYTYTAANSASTENATTAVSNASTVGGVAISYLWGTIKNVGGYTVAIGKSIAAGAYYPAAGQGTAIAYCQTSASLTTPANWTVTAATLNTGISDITYFSGSFYAAGYGGIWQYTGSAWVQVLTLPANSVWSITTNGTVMVAVGQDPINSTQAAIWTSTNGTVWNKQIRFVWAGALVAAQNMFPGVIWDGARFITTGGLNNNLVATSTDGVAWNAISAPDFAETTGTASLSFLGVYSGLQNTATGVFTPWGVAAGNVSGVGLIASAAAASLRTVTATSITAGVQANSTQTASVSAIAGVLGAAPPSTLSHYYELIFTTVPGTVNLFNVSWAIDNAILGVIGQYQLASPTDTLGTAQAYLNLPRNGQWTVIDDIYVTNFTGPYHNSRLGVQRIYPFAPTSDVTDVMSTTIGGATNSNTVNTALSNSEGYVYSTAPTAQDIYGTTNSVPASGNTVNAVQVEGYLMAQNSAAGTGTVGLQSNSVKSLGPVVSTNSNPTRAALIQETDPNTNVPWTVSGLNAVDIVVAKTS